MGRMFKDSFFGCVFGCLHDHIDQHLMKVKKINCYFASSSIVTAFEAFLSHPSMLYSIAI